MKTIDFTHKKFHEIPHQDNPAYGDEECFMVVRQSDYSPQKRRFVVLKIVPHKEPLENETVTQIAEFWDSALAMDFTETYALKFSSIK